MPYSSARIACPVCDQTFPHWRREANAYRGPGCKGPAKVWRSNYDVMIRHVVLEHPNVYEEYLKGNHNLDGNLCDCGSCAICEPRLGVGQSLEKCKCGKPDCEWCRVRHLEWKKGK